MAKRGNRIVILQKCTVCGNLNYSTVINRVNQRAKKLEVKKHCKVCKKHTDHKMVKTSH